MRENPQGVWIGPDGRAQPVRVKGGPLFDALHGITRRRDRDLGASPADLARAYVSAVWAYRCIKLRADAVASVPLGLLDRNGAPLDDHPLLDLLRDVNPTTMNLGDLLRATEAAYNIWGVAYWLKVRTAGPSSARNGVRWLVWLNPQTVEAITDPAHGVVAYRQTVGAQTQEFRPEDVIVFRNFDPFDDLGGLSPLAVALSEVNADLNAARFVAAFFANDARPAGLLTSDSPLHESEMERVRTWWERLFQGARNRWKTGIVASGLKWQTITFPPTDLALAELRAEDRRAICAVFGVPPGLAGAWESATYATAREQKASFYEDTVLPQLDYLAEVLNRSLLTHYPDLTARGARLAWDTDSIAALRESATDKARRLVMLFEAGVITRDEARVEMGMLPLGELPEGDDQPSGPADRLRAGQGDQEAADLLAVPEKTTTEIKAELARWERFAVRRIKAKQPLRPFKTTVIPLKLWQHVTDRLAQAQTAEEVVALFAEARELCGVRTGLPRPAGRSDHADG